MSLNSCLKHRCNPACLVETMAAKRRNNTANRGMFRVGHKPRAWPIPQTFTPDRRS